MFYGYIQSLNWILTGYTPTPCQRWSRCPCHSHNNPQSTARYTRTFHTRTSRFHCTSRGSCCLPLSRMKKKCLIYFWQEKKPMRLKGHLNIIIIYYLKFGPQSSHYCKQIFICVQEIFTRFARALIVVVNISCSQFLPWTTPWRVFKIIYILSVKISSCKTVLISGKLQKKVAANKSWFTVLDSLRCLDKPTIIPTLL